MFFHLQFKDPRCKLTCVISRDGRLYWVEHGLYALMSNETCKIKIMQLIHDTFLRDIMPDSYRHFGGFSAQTQLLETQTLLEFLEKYGQTQMKYDLQDLVGKMAYAYPTRVYLKSKTMFENALLDPLETVFDAERIPTVVVLHHGNTSAHSLLDIVKILKIASRRGYKRWYQSLESSRSQEECVVEEFIEKLSGAADSHEDEEPVIVDPIVSSAHREDAPMNLSRVKVETEVELDDTFERESVRSGYSPGFPPDTFEMQKDQEPGVQIPDSAPVTTAEGDVMRSSEPEGTQRYEDTSGETYRIFESSDNNDSFKILYMNNKKLLNENGFSKVLLVRLNEHKMSLYTPSDIVFNI